MGDSLQERMGKRVKELRARKLLTLEELGKLADMKPGTISQFERGVRKAQARTAKRLAQALGVTPEYLTADDPVSVADTPSADDSPTNKKSAA